METNPRRDRESFRNFHKAGVARIGMVLAACAFCILFSSPLRAQDADVSGTVRDTSGSVIATASVKLTNESTGTSLATQTNEKGLYSFPHVQAGVYDLSVSDPGFQSQQHVGITVNVADRMQINFDLKVGSANESITVTGEEQSIDAADAVTGQTINRTFINDLPLLSRSALDLAFLAPGVNQPPSFVYGQGASVVPYLTSNNFVSNGSRNATSDIQIDGITTGETVSGGLSTFASYTPSVDAVQEFKVQQTNFSAEYGFSGATITNVITRSGTNSFHGSAFEFLRNDRFDANNYFNNQSGIKLPPLRQHIFGVTFGGPIFKNRTFFFFDYEGTRIHSLGTVIAGVPSAAEKQGNFGEVCTLQGGTFDNNGMCSNPNGQLWDPYTGTYSASAGGPVRSGFIPYNNMATYTSPGNSKLNGTGFQLAPQPGNLIDPVALKLMQYYPAPNRGVGTPRYDRLNNWIGSGINILNNDQWDLRIDHHFNDRDLLSAKYAHRGTFQHAINCFGNLADPCTQGPVDSTAHLFSLNFSHIFSGSTVFSFSYGLTRTFRFYHTPKGDYPSLDPVQTLGMPSYIETSGVPQLPAIYVNGGYTPAQSGGASIGTQAWSYLRDGQDTHDLLAALSRLQGRHEIKVGGEFRLHRFNNGQPGTPAGLFVFDFNGTSQQPWSGGGDAMASLLIGTSTNSWGQYEVPAFLSTQNFNWGGYVQDNFHASRKLTVDVGLRYDLTLPATERHNELNWVDPTVPSPLQVPGLPPLKGGDMFANSQVRTNFDTDYRNIQPRIGLAYSLNDKTVVRTGYGIYFDPSRASASADAVGVQGFAQKTPWITTYRNDGATPWGRLSNPFPNGVALPPGRSLGLLTDVGLAAMGPDRRLNSTPYEQSWSFGIQRSLPWNVLIDATYVGKKGTHLYFGGAGHINHLGPQEEHYSAAQIAALNTFVNNPFYGIITDPTSPLSGPQVSEYQLQLPYPQFTDFDITSPPWANSIYHAFQLRVEKRFSNGLQFLVTYVKSKSLDNATIAGEGNSFLGGSSSSILNPNNLALERSLSQFDIPQVWQFSYVYQLPIGRGKRFAGGLNPVLNAIIGGWQTNGIWRFDNGQPIMLGLSGGQPLPGYGQRPELTAVPRRNHGSDWLTQYFANPDAFTVPAAYTLGNAPRTLSLRNPGTANASLSAFKEFPLSKVREGMRLEFRFESFNAFNHPQFCGPNAVVGSGSFGNVTCQANSPREVQMALKLYF
jgi:hypothetical protein